MAYLSIFAYDILPRYFLKRGGDIKCKQTEIKRKKRVELTVEISNNSDIFTEEVMQKYVKPIGSIPILYQFWFRMTVTIYFVLHVPSLKSLAEPMGSPTFFALIHFEQF